MTELIKVTVFAEEGIPVVVILINDDSNTPPKMMKLMLDNQ